VRLTRVYAPIALSPGALVELPSGAARHLAGVLRLGAGAPVILFNGLGGEHAAVIESIRGGAVAARIGAHRAIERESPLQVTLMQGIARGEKMDLILQKATELGVSRMVPLTALRSSVRLTQQTAARKVAHWQAVVASACEQCGRNRVPQVAAPVGLESAVQAAGAGAGLKLLLAADDQADALPAWLQRRAASDPVTLLIGPEGGLDPEEVRVAKQAGFAACRVGPRILRTETAGLAALAALQVLEGDLR
jgi:16S rRNA (uracil1498-N3)-methyltransferase